MEREGRQEGGSEARRRLRIKGRWGRKHETEDEAMGRGWIRRRSRSGGRSRGGARGGNMCAIWAGKMTTATQKRAPHASALDDDNCDDGVITSMVLCCLSN